MPKRRPKHIPIRSCVVCRQTSDKRALLRVVRQPDKLGGAVVVDPTGKMSGRGAYVCATEKCIGLAQKQRRFERALSVPQDAVSVDVFQDLLTLAQRSANPDPAPQPETNSGASAL